MSCDDPPRPKRSLGQNFLVNTGVRDKIVRALDPGPRDWVVELGPGPGALTSPLSERCAHLVAVELDGALAQQLPSRTARPEVLEILGVDGAQLDYAELAGRAGRQLLVVGNLPFNAASAMLRQALDQRTHLARLVLMFQREVALRLTAAPHSRTYGLLTVVTQQRATVERLFDVSPGSFHPAPRVSASVLRFFPRDALPPCCLLTQDRLAKAAFGQRRKTLRNGLKARAPWPWTTCSEALDQVGISPDQRAEEVSVAEFARLGQWICRQSGACEAVP
ncbi:MAG: 16S rRNA (adenine(1518)-N(6)/adenine(1519)-N(6))-dimethyltransferase RsmA [bacterium]